MSSSLHLFLVRHAEAMAFSAHADPDPALTPRGRHQAALLAAWQSRHPPDAIVSSTLRRAAQTAEIVSQRVGVPVSFDSRLREVGMCWPDGQPVVGPRPGENGFAPRERPTEPVFPGGERWVDFRKRVGEAMDDVLAGWSGAEQRVVCVCHGGVLDALFDNITNAVGASAVEITLANTGMTHLEYRPGPPGTCWILRRHNHQPHLAVRDSPG
jgi:broad specificity phosphatase PhoE